VLFGFTILAVALAACGGGAATQTSGDLKGTITVSGAWALYPMMTRLGDEESRKLHPRGTVPLSRWRTSGKGMTDAPQWCGRYWHGFNGLSPLKKKPRRLLGTCPVVKDAVFPYYQREEPIFGRI